MLALTKVKNVMAKTGGVCSICGRNKHMTIRKFIPSNIRLSDDSYENLIPICGDCDSRYRNQFLEIGWLSTLPSTFVEMCLRYYMKNSKFYYKFVIIFGNKLYTSVYDVEKALLVMQSYEKYVNENKQSLEWENLNKEIQDGGKCGSDTKV